MATVRQYGYYIKGNKVAIVEKDTQFDNDVNSKDYGPGSDRAQWKSPLATVADGLELQYVYSPTYRIKSDWEEGEDLHKFLGWGSDGENLMFFTYGASAVLDLTSKYSVSDYIYVRGSSRWSGVHKVKTVNNDGRLTTTTKLNLQASNIYGPVSFDTDETIAGSDDGTTPDADSEIEVFKSNISHRSPQYIFARGASNAVNEGFFKLSSDSTVGQLTVSSKFTIKDEDNSYLESTPALADEEATVNIYSVFYEEIDILENIEVMEDEDYVIDLPNYLSKALVYYVKAKIMEDGLDIEGKEYFMREFRKMVEKHNNTRVAGLRIQASGPFAIR